MGLAKYIAFTINRNLVFIDRMQFKNSSLDTLVKNLSDNHFKYLNQEFIYVTVEGWYEQIIYFSMV